MSSYAYKKIKQKIPAILMGRMEFHNLTFAQMGKILGCSGPMVSMIKNGKLLPERLYLNACAFWPDLRNVK